MSSVISRLRKELEQALAPAQTIAAKAESENRELTPEERTAIKVAFDSATDVKTRIAAAEADDDMVKNMNALGLQPGQLSGDADAPAAKGRSFTVGQKFTEAEAIKAWHSSIAPTGEIPKSARVHSPAISFGGVKDILSGGDRVDGPGLLVNRQELGLIDQGRFERPLTIRSLVTNGQTTSDTIHYVREAGYTNNAAPVPEAAGVEPYATGTGQVQGLKPQSTFVLSEQTETVKTIAHWLPVTKRALSDAAQVRTLIDEFLRYGLEEELEDQMVNGSGSGENFRGLLQTSGRQQQAWDTDLLVTTRRAKTKVRTVGRATATAFLFNPADNERIDLLQGTNGYGDPSGYIFGNPAGLQVQTLWGLPRVESEAVPAGTGIVADFRRAILWDREQAAIQMSDSHADFFIRNLVAILAELRAAFTVVRPSAVVEIDLTA